MANGLKYKKVNIKILVAKWQQAKSEAALAGQTVNQWVVDTIEARLENKEGK